ncbi:MAG: hypothetical protein R2715_08500 [Ilumatobacteraceae bacterium]
MDDIEIEAGDLDDCNALIDSLVLSDWEGATFRSGRRARAGTEEDRAQTSARYILAPTSAPVPVSGRHRPTWDRDWTEEERSNLGHTPW